MSRFVSSVNEVNTENKFGKSLLKYKRQLRSENYSPGE